MKQWNDLSVHQRGNVRPLGPIAPVAGKAEILRLIGTAMLFCEDMLDMKHGKRELVLAQATILTAAISSLTNLPAKSDTDRHQGCPMAVSWARALAWRTPIKFMPRTYDS